MSEQQERPDQVDAPTEAETEVAETAQPDASADPTADAAGEETAPTETGDVDAPTAEDTPDWAALAEADPRSPAELLAELTEAEARRDEYLEDVRRARAEFENYRKRVMREGTAQRDHGRAEVAGRLLDVLDDFDRTLEAAEATSDEGLAKGVQLVHGKLVGALTELGLTRIDETGVAFDPNRHEAVQQLPADEPVDEPVVAQVFRPGYEMNGRVLRAAMVVVQQ